MAKLYDIVMIDGVEHIVSEIKGNSISKTIPLQDYVINCRIIEIDGEYISIRELVNREMENIRCGLVDTEIQMLRADVVKCKDCIHRRVPTRCSLWTGTLGANDYFLERGDNFYCAFGERTSQKGI